MSCPANSTLQICDMLSETGTGVGEFSNGATANGGLTKFIMLLAIVGAVVAIVFAVVFVIKRAITRPGGKHM